MKAEMNYLGLDKTTLVPREPDRRRDGFCADRMQLSSVTQIRETKNELEEQRSSSETKEKMKRKTTQRIHNATPLSYMLPDSATMRYSKGWSRPYTALDERNKSGEEKVDLLEKTTDWVQNWDISPKQRTNSKRYDYNFTHKIDNTIKGRTLSDVYRFQKYGIIPKRSNKATRDKWPVQSTLKNIEPAKPTTGTTPAEKRTFEESSSIVFLPSENDIYEEEAAPVTSVGEESLRDSRNNLPNLNYPPPNYEADVGDLLESNAEEVLRTLLPRARSTNSTTPQPKPIPKEGKKKRSAEESSEKREGKKIKATDHGNLLAQEAISAIPKDGELFDVPVYYDFSI